VRLPQRFCLQKQRRIGDFTAAAFDVFHGASEAQYEFHGEKVHAKTLNCTEIIVYTVDTASFEAVCKI